MMRPAYSCGDTVSQPRLSTEHAVPRRLRTLLELFEE